MKAVAIALALLGTLIMLSPFAVVPPTKVLEEMGDREVLFAVWLSLATSLVSTALVLSLALPTAYSLSRGFAGSGLVEALLSAPNALPPVAVGALLLIFFSRTPIGQLVDSVIPIVFSVPGIIIAQASVTFPLALKPLRSAMRGLHEDVLLMARTLGCTNFCLFKKIILPSISNTLKSSSVLVFTRSLAEFGATVTLAGSIRFKTETLPIAIYLNMSSGNLEKMIALITLASFLGFALLSLSKRWES
ncbi:molybdate ABC transporter permease subunit [Ignicoccus hospitalis]|uniref:Binding-protein-dependent transport systems inner membrane component n=1 Tax=Ignicoccus hospitalis (strain KIN4/I / DSM 18386 / JCM 14125) TaxID=453591 RepID=A8AC64_IGNH4|nr:ABC transporter permease subunit [Ignicoccus hospitalis]ABU82516.1 binding-protein-dependent transport systems inner membrane component [Ignicoccus hospitalis KIN4/I]HIH90679.1 ABC transporter permease subunit [Desulfurococcaceae archaeon]